MGAAYPYGFDRLRRIEAELTKLVSQKARLWCIAYRDSETFENVFEVSIVKDEQKVTFSQTFESWSEVPNDDIQASILLLAG